MPAPEFPTTGWFTSSYSNSNGGDCVEVAFTGWRTSSHSGGNGGSCVEVAFAAPAVGIRDSKDRTAGHLTLPTPAWRALLTQVRSGAAAE
ncbi:DUF397 domain-containing protein [Amycolatopsis sp. NPDC059027]|uniref:DUF397 domain-containing protein n=1 Tax=unclassified Amycolatopsis TaxID=2618356 RepID=UPI00366F5B24